MPTSPLPTASPSCTSILRIMSVTPPNDPTKTSKQSWGSCDPQSVARHGCIGARQAGHAGHLALTGQRSIPSGVTLDVRRKSWILRRNLRGCRMCGSGVRLTGRLGGKWSLVAAALLLGLITGGAHVRAATVASDSLRLSQRSASGCMASPSNSVRRVKAVM